MEIHISIPQQRLTLSAGARVVRDYRVSTARNGPGERMGSDCTPRGAHAVRAKIGADCAHGTVFVSRRPTGEVWGAVAPVQDRPDPILCRILWLCGREPGKNRFGPVDTMRRYIYIHGCPDSSPMGIPLSHGCIRMRNADIAELFDMVDIGTLVYIHDRPCADSVATAAR